MSKSTRILMIAAAWFGVGAGQAHAGAADKKLDVYLVDVEGGAATLFVTPAGETVLIDTGYPGDRDAERVTKAVTELAGLKKINHLVVTHFHDDHYGGLGDIAKRIPIGTLYTRDIAKAPEKERGNANVPQLKEVKVARRVRVRPGMKLPLKQIKGAAPLSFQILGANEKFVPAKGAAANAALCKDQVARDPDQSDNRNSVVSLITFGPFRYFEGGDLTFNTEAALVCPKNLVGKPVDVYQTNHHGLDQSNNPILIKSLAPTVALMNNGPKKGGDKGTFTALKATPSIKDIYQVHRNVRVGAELNTDPALVANADENCKGDPLKLSVDPSGKTYSVLVAATKHERTYQTH